MDKMEICHLHLSIFCCSILISLVLVAAFVALVAVIYFKVYKQKNGELTTKAIICNKQTPIFKQHKGCKILETVSNSSKIKSLIYQTF